MKNEVHSPNISRMSIKTISCSSTTI
jgi:hypothetical protein